MDQLSVPYRIALAAIVVAAALYFVVLAPKDDTAPAVIPAVATAPAKTTATTAVTTTPAKTTGTTAPGVRGLATAIDKAKLAAASQGRSDAASGGTVATTPVTPAATATTTPATTPPPATTTAVPSKPEAVAASTDPSAAVLADLRRGHTAVLLFVGPSGSDDRAVRRAVQHINRHRGTVDVHVVSIKRVGDYEAITRGVTVLQAPTTLVIGKARTARTVVGFTTTNELDQLVSDALRG